MDRFRRIARNPREALARLTYARALAFLLVVVLPGGLFVPICVGIYGAIRQGLSGKVAARAPAAPAVNPAVDEP